MLALSELLFNINVVLVLGSWQSFVSWLVVLPDTQKPTRRIRNVGKYTRRGRRKCQPLRKTKCILMCSLVVVCMYIIVWLQFFTLFLSLFWVFLFFGGEWGGGSLKVMSFLLWGTCCVSCEHYLSQIETTLAQRCFEINTEK